MALVQIADVIVPEVFDEYVQQQTEVKDNLITSGVVVPDPSMDAMLAGGGLTFNVPSWQPLARTASTPATDATGDTLTPEKHSTSKEIAVRLSRAEAWEAADLAGLLAGSDPMASIASQVGQYWSFERQDTFIATMVGLLADNVANDSSDLISDISGSSYVAGVTDFSAEAAVDAMVTAGDSMNDFTTICMHSVVFARMVKNNLIDFVQDSTLNTRIAFFMNRRVIVDDSITNSANVYETWFFGPGAFKLGRTPAPNPTAIEREELQGFGFGVERLISRQVWSIHPVGFAWSAAANTADGGPSNAATTYNLGAATSWDRVYPQRKQIKIACLKTREA